MIKIELSLVTTGCQHHATVILYRTGDSESAGLISSVGVTDIYSRQYKPEKEIFACGL